MSASNASINSMSVTNLSANNISVTSITVGNASSYNVSIYNASITNMSASNASINSMSVTNLSANNISVTSITVGNASAYNISILNASVNSITVGNASAYNVSIYNASVTNLSASAANIYNVISPNIDASATQLTIGGTTSTSLVLGKAANTTNILGNLKINSDSGSAGQVLTSNGNNTVPTWTTVSGVGGGGWVGTALSNLSMGIYSIIGSILDSSGTNLSIGDTTAASVTIGKASNVTNILGNLQIAGSAGEAGKVLTSNATTAVWSDTSWVGTATSNLSMGANSIICSNIDASATALTIGGVTAQGLTIGKALTDTNILGNLKIAGDAGTLGQVLRSNATTAEWVDYGTATANLAMGTYSITGTSLDSATTLALGTTTATTTTLGRTAVGTITNINGSTVNISGTTINLGINTSSTSNINVGTLQFLGDVLGSTINVIDGSTVNVSGVMRIADKLTAGAIRIGSSLTSGDIIIGNHNSTNSAELRTGATLQLGNRATVINMGASANISSGIFIGNASSSISLAGKTIGITGSTSITLSGAVSGLTMSGNQFITMGTNTALPAVNQIGYIYTTTPNGSGFVDNAVLTTGVAQEYATIANVPAGVYMVSANLNMQQVALTTITSVIITLSATGNSTYNDRKAFVNGAIAINNYNISGIFSRGSTLTAVACSMTVSFTGSAPKMSVDSFKFNIVRIA